MKYQRFILEIKYTFHRLKFKIEWYNNEIGLMRQIRVRGLLNFFINEVNIKMPYFR